MKKFFIVGLFLFLTGTLSPVLTAQTNKKSKKVIKKPPVVAVTPQQLPDSPVEPAVKKNERPSEAANDAKSNGRAVSPAIVPTYFYEFTRPGFTYSRILIEHNDAGKGKISFLKDGFNELITDPLGLSVLTLAKINDALTALNFLDSTENYQHEHDFSNLGNIQITIKQAGRERTIKYNWTSNKDAKMLMDEYRRIANEYTWKFEITTARENQPLLTPGLIDAVDAYLRRNEISDPQGLVPFLTQLSMDERLPLIARNHTTKLISQIEKAKK